MKATTSSHLAIINHTSYFDMEHQDREGKDSAAQYQTPTYEHREAASSTDPADELVHCHNIGDDLDEKRLEVLAAKRKLGIACFFVLIFIVGEFIGGYLSGSLAIMSDAAHMCSDLANFAVSLVALYVAEKKPKRKYTFGYYRAEVLGALLTVVSIWYVSGILLYLAVHRLATNEFEVESDMMTIVAASAVLFNIILAIILHGVCNVPHSHGHSHNGGGHDQHVYQSFSSCESDEDYDEDAADWKRSSHKKKEQNINIRAALIHVFGDLLQSIGVFLSSVIIRQYPTAKWVDPVCTLVFCLIVFLTTINILKDATRIIMEGAPGSLDYEAIEEDLLLIPHVKHVHELHLWCLTMNQPVMSCHLTVEAHHLPLASHILAKATKMLARRHQILSVTIQIEPHNQSIVANCHKCQAMIN